LKVWSTLYLQVVEWIKLMRKRVERLRIENINQFVYPKRSLTMRKIKNVNLFLSRLELL